MRSRTCIGALFLLPLTLAACGTDDTDPAEPTHRMDATVETGAPPPPPATIDLTPDPTTGALNPHDVENAVRAHASAELAGTTLTHNHHIDVHCLTGGPPLIHPATTLCHAQVSAPELATYTTSYGVVLTDTPGRILITPHY
ncbi:hypothetical protein ACWDUD_21730 [Rhodococcus sp. NPDC003382]